MNNVYSKFYSFVRSKVGNNIVMILSNSTYDCISEVIFNHVFNIIYRKVEILLHHSRMKLFYLTNVEYKYLQQYKDNL
jgi:hypothetical protein